MSRIREYGAYFFYKELFLSYIPKGVIPAKKQYEKCVESFRILPANLKSFFTELHLKEKEKMENGEGRLMSDDKLPIPDAIVIWVKNFVKYGWKILVCVLPNNIYFSEISGPG